MPSSAAVAASSSSTASPNVPSTSSINPNREDEEEPSSKEAYEPETVRPEWLGLPPELQEIDFTKENSVAWDKYQPYSDTPPVLMPVDHAPPRPSTGSSSSSITTTVPPLVFYLHALDGRARAGTIHFPNQGDNPGPPVPTPRFMPVGTKGTIKGVLPEEIHNDANCPILLANTYHLALQPGTELIDKVFGGLPKFMGGQAMVATSAADQKDEETESSEPPKKKKRRLFNLLTDSGGFQMVSLAALSVVTENGVIFESPYTKGKRMTLKPEDSIRCQNEIGADIIMQLDDVVSSLETDAQRFRLATLRTLRWYDRCVQAHARPETQSLYPILQGHLDTSRGGLREICLAGFRHRDTKSGGNGNKERTIPGFAIGGLAGGESKDDFWKVVDHACRHLPDDRPRYLMGVGYPLDLVICTALGVDQYDCVYPTRTARFGVALRDEGPLKLKQHECASQSDLVILPGCPCPACSRNVSRARLHALLKSPDNVLGMQLVTNHNICYMMGLVTRMRQAILEKRFATFVRDFIQIQFAGTEAKSGSSSTIIIPSWVKEALHAAGIELDESCGVE